MLSWPRTRGDAGRGVARLFRTRNSCIRDPALVILTFLLTLLGSTGSEWDSSSAEALDSVSARWSAAFSRDRLGLEVDRGVGSGASAVRGYWWRDALGRPTQHWVGQAAAPEGASPVSHRTRKYGWDPGDLLRTLEDDALGSVAYEHDVRGFLQKAEVTPKDGGEPRVELRNPDEVGNLFASLDRSDREYGQAGQVLKRSGPDGVTTYRYDADGNLAQREDPDGGRWWFHWNGAGQLVQVDKPGGTAVTFRYDAFGRRVEKNADGVVTRWVWDGNLPLHEWRSEGDAPEVLRTPELRGRRKGLLTARERLGDNEAWAEALRSAAEDEVFGWLAEELLGELERAPDDALPEEDEDGVLTWLFEPESFAPLARVSEQRGAMAVFTDHLGTPLCLTDEGGAVAWQGVTDTFGRCEVTEGDAGLCPWRFPGQYEDAETGLFYNRFRYYSAEVGGYVSRDPIGLAGGLAVHAYVGDPLGWMDPLGLADARPGGCGTDDSVELDPRQARLADSTGFIIDSDGTVRRAPVNYHPKGPSLSERAEALGYDKRIPPQKAPFDSHGQDVFTNGKKFISPDVDGHNVTDGWKMFDRRGRRIGTYSPDLSERLKD